MKSIFVGVTAALALGAAGANAYTIVENGSFETGPTNAGVFGDFFDDMPGSRGNASWDVWTGTDFPDWEVTGGTGIEIQTVNTINGGGAINPFDGDYYVELDSHPNGGSSTTNSRITQSLGELDAGFYQLSFAYSPRVGDATNETDGIGYQVKNGIELTGGVTSGMGTVDDWVIITSDTFEVKDGTGPLTLSFFANTDQDTLGGFIDAVKISQIPLPASALFLLSAVAGFGGLGALRKRRAA